jgi:hypothetical protein
MQTLSKVTLSHDVSADAVSIPAGQQIQLVPPGVKVLAILVRQIIPVSMQIRLHFGTSDKDGMAIYQGETFNDDHYGELYDAGVGFSYRGAIAAGSSLEIVIIYPAGI